MKNQEPVRLMAVEAGAPASLRDALGAAAEGPRADELSQLTTAVHAAVIAGAGMRGWKGWRAAELGMAGKVGVLLLGAGLVAVAWLAHRHAAVGPTTLAPLESSQGDREHPPSDPEDSRPVLPAVAAPAPPAPLPVTDPGVALTPQVAPAQPSSHRALPRRGPLPLPPPSSAGTQALSGASAGEVRPEAALAPDELQLLAQAHAQLTAQPERALTLAREHERRFPQGRLAQERDILVIEALQRLGRSTQAREAGDRFRVRYPGSPYGRELAGPQGIDK